MASYRGAYRTSRSRVMLTEEPFDLAGFSVRGGDGGDLEGILAIERAAHPTPWRTSIFEDELSLDWSHLWIVEDSISVEPVAFLVFWAIHDEIHILNIAVHPSRRRQGVARRLIQRLQAEASGRAYSFITLEVRQRNTAARRLYASLDFHESGERPDYYADTGEAAILMHRLL